MRGRRCVLLGLALLPLAARASIAQHRVIVTSNGWHSGIAVPRDDLSASVLPEIADFPTAAFVEFGWGDAEFYTTPQAGLGTALKAAFPGPAVMHVAGLHDHPRVVYPTGTALTLVLDGAQLQRLVAYIAGSMARTGSARVPASAPGLYTFSKFYPASGRFSAFNTCNTWTARALAAAGLAVDPDGVQTADELLRRVRALRREIL